MSYNGKVHIFDGELKTKIMANIQTPIRLIKVKETYEEVLYKSIEFQWVELTEEILFYNKTSDEMDKRGKKIILNRDYIIEIQS